MFIQGKKKGKETNKIIKKKRSFKLFCFVYYHETYYLPFQIDLQKEKWKKLTGLKSITPVFQHPHHVQRASSSTKPVQ